MTDGQIIKKIEEVIQDLRPNIQMDGGDIEFISFNNGIVSIKLLGACVNCPMSMYTLKLGIEERLRENIPDVQEVISVD